MKFKKIILAAALGMGISSVAQAGPIILGGDDLTDHGSVSGAGVNLNGWNYIEQAIANINPSVTRAGVITHTIAALGSAASSATGGNAGAAIDSVASVLGLTVIHYNGAAAITQFFVDLASGTVNPGILHLAGTGASNDLDSAEGAALTADAAAINSFVGSGGGLLAHGSGTTAYGWLSALLPGVGFPSGCTNSGATLTAAGSAAFPGLSNSDIQAGPCHNNFTGLSGGLIVLARDGSTAQRAFIIGNNNEGGSITDPGTSVPAPAGLALLAIGLLGMRFSQRKKA